MKLKYEKINKDNIIIASKIQYQIFLNACAYAYYLENIDKKELPLELLVYCDSEPIGVIGLYEIKSFPDTIWLSWFGVLEEYRNNGIGKKMIEDIKKIAKTYQKKFLRLYTYEVWNSVAQPFYEKVMEISEYYYNEKENQKDIQMGKPKIYGVSLCNEKIEYWNNQFIDITKEDTVHEESIKLMKKHKLIR